MDYGAVFKARKRTGLVKIRQFHGINQATDESDLAAAAGLSGCYTPKGVNFWIKNGNLTVRNNYERASIGGSATGAPITSVTPDMADAYTYKVASLWAYTPTTGDTYLLAGVDAFLSGVHHHFCLVHRKRDVVDTWKEVKNSGTHSLGDAAQDIGAAVWFSNANFTFANYSGDFYEPKNTDEENFATVITNGQDMPMFYINSGTNNCLSVLGSSGWVDVAIAGNTLTTSGTTQVFTDEDCIELHSRTQQMPQTANGALASGATYYVAHTSGLSFKLQDSNKNDIVITSIGANVIAHMKCDYGPWESVTAKHAASTFTCANLAAAGKMIMFSGSLPTGLSGTASYVVTNVSGNTFQITCPSSKTPSAIVEFTSDGKNVKARYVMGNPADAPRGNNIMVYSDRLWMNVRDSIYYGAGVYDDPSTSAVRTLARPNDWSNAQYVGNVSEPSWDGETLNVMKLVNGKPFIGKPHSVYAIDGAAPPFTFRQIYNARGTTAPKSVCWHISGGMFEVTPEGILVYNGTATSPYVSLEIQNIWKADAHTGAIGAVVGDVLHVYGSYNRPDTGTPENGLIVINILTKDICYWDMLSPTIIASNIISNGNFTSLANWSATAATLGNATQYLCTITGNGAANYTYAAQATTTPWMNGHKIYFKMYVNVGNSNAVNFYTAVYGTTTGGICAATVTAPTANNWYAASGVVTLASGSGNLMFGLVTSYPDATTANGKTTTMQAVMAVDLTATFGSGHEPTAAQFESIMTSNGFSSLWFGGNATLNSSSYPALLTVDAVLDARFTLSSRYSDVANSIPQFWFASGDTIYRVGMTAPGAGQAMPMIYYLPENDFGDASVQKHLSRITVTGSGGNLSVTPTQDGIDKPAKYAPLPAKPILMQVNGRRVRLKLANTGTPAASGGDPVVVRDIEQVYS